MAKTAILTKDGLVRYDSNIKDYIKDLTDDTIYIDPDETSTDLPDIDPVTSAKYVSYGNTNSGLEADTVQEAIDETSAIAKGKNRARVFSTTEDMNAWLSDEANKGVAIVGDNLYIVELEVPDWWISEVLEEADAETGFYYKIAQLETQKVDLTNIETSINNIETRLITGASLVNHDFNDLGDEPLIGLGSNMTNDPIGNTAVRYHVVHIPAYNNFETVQYAKPINYGSGTLLFFRQQKHDKTWSEWCRVVISSEIANMVTCVESNSTSETVEGIGTVNRRYYKYSDGRMVVSMSWTVTTDITSAWGSIFVSANLNSPDFPAGFIAVPYFTMTSHTIGNSGAAWVGQAGGIGNGQPTATNPGQIVLMRPTSVTGIQATIHIVAEGVWK